MEYKKLGDIATYINGYAFKPEQRGSEGLPIIRIQDLTGNAYDLGYYDGDYPKKIELNDGDVLISWSASLGVYLWNRGKALLNQHIFKVVFDKVEIDKFYFMYAVEYNLDKMSLKTHGATMKHITKKDFDNVVIPYPDLDYQKEVSYRLTSLKGIIEKYREQLELLDELVKARFVEMFSRNQYEMIRLADVCTKITDGTHKTPNYLSEGITFISAKNIVRNKLDFSDVKYISEDEYQDIQKRCQTEFNDILLSKSGSLGTPVIVKTEKKLGLFESLAVLKYDRSKLVPEFLCEQLKTEEIQRQFKVGVKGVAIKHLHLGVIGNVKIIVPPLELQNQFASFVEEVDKSRSRIQKSLEASQELFDSLMQEYFG